MPERKVAVITGGSKGIGRALVERFVGEDFTVYTTARNISELESLGIDKINALSADLSKKTEVIAFADWVKAKTDSIDVLVNNVGIYIPGKISEEEDQVFEKQININVACTYHLTRALLPLMDKSSKAHLFNICSTASITPYVNGGSYCISKYAQYGLTKVLREELKPRNIKVSAVLPGATLTGSWEGTDLPQSRFILPDSVAQLIWTAYQLGDNSVMEEILIRPMEGDIS